MKTIQEELREFYAIFPCESSRIMIEAADKIDEIAHKLKSPRKPVTTTGTHELEAVLDAYRKAAGIPIIRNGDQAFYSPDRDCIALPKEFKSYEGMLATYAHEAAHSTGHSSRLDRLERFARFGGDKYAAEELVAEMCAAYFTGLYGVDGQYENHKAYLQSWLKALTNDPALLFTAASQAAKREAMRRHVYGSPQA